VGMKTQRLSAHCQTYISGSIALFVCLVVTPAARGRQPAQQRAAALVDTLIKTALSDYQGGDLGAAIAGLREARQADPANPYARLYLGLFLYQEDPRNAEAQDLMESALTAFPSNPDLLLRLADSYLALGHGDKISGLRERGRKALDANPRLALNITYVLIRYAQLDPAREELDRAAAKIQKELEASGEPAQRPPELARTRGEVLFLKGMIAATAGQKEAAIEQFQAADRNDFPPQDSPQMKMLAEVLVGGRDRTTLVVRAEAGVDAPDLRVVEEVEEVGAQSDPRAFRDPEVLGKSRVDIADTRQAEGVPAGRPVLAVQRPFERRRANPIVMVLPRVRVADEIGVLAPAVHAGHVAVGADGDRHAGLGAEHPADLPTVEDLAQNRAGQGATYVRELVDEIDRGHVGPIVTSGRIVHPHVERVPDHVGVVVHQVHRLRPGVVEVEGEVLGETTAETELHGVIRRVGVRLHGVQAAPTVVGAQRVVHVVHRSPQVRSRRQPFELGRGGQCRLAAGPQSRVAALQKGGPGTSRPVGEESANSGI
jgi:hypothetical protein